MINHRLTIAERIPLITDLFSDCDETEAVERLIGDDAQSLVDVVDEVLPRSFTSENTADINPNYLAE